MSCPETEEIEAAPPPPRCSTPPQDESNDGAAHAESNAEGTNAESDADVEKQFDESTGKKPSFYFVCNACRLEAENVEQSLYTILHECSIIYFAEIMRDA